MNKFLLAGYTTIASVIVSSQSLDSIIEKHLEAVGGKSNIQKLHSVIIEGNTGTGNSLINVSYYQKEHEAYKQAISVGGMKSFVIVTPGGGWKYNPGDEQVSPLDAEESLAMQNLMNVKGLLYEHKKNGISVVDDGEEVYDGKVLLRIRCIDTLAHEWILLLDPDTYMLAKKITRIKKNGRWQESLTEYDDYREVNGVMMPFAISLPIGRVQVEKIRLNSDIDERIFMPFKNQ